MEEEKECDGTCKDCKCGKLEKICEYAGNKHTFGSTGQDAWDCKAYNLPQKLTCFEPKKFLMCFYYQESKKYEPKN